MPKKTEGDTARRPVPDILIVGAGPTGIAIGAEARMAGLEPLLVDRGPLTANLLEFPTYMGFFTTRDLLEIARIPFAIPEDKPDLRQAVTYYRAVAARFQLPLAPYEEVSGVGREGDLFRITSRSRGELRQRQARAVALATGYFHNPRVLEVRGADSPWVHTRYRDPYRHFGERVVVVGGGNSAVEAALDLYRNGAKVTLVHRGSKVKSSVKYWLRPDLQNRLEEGALEARFESRVRAFSDLGVEIEGPRGPEVLAADAAYLLIGYLPDVELERQCGIEVDSDTLIPTFDPETCESNVEGLYVAGTLQAGKRTDKIFIENSREHGRQIVRHLKSRLRPQTTTEPPGR